MALRDGYVECALVWRLFMEQVGASWTGRLFNPLNECVSRWVGKPDPGELIESACTDLQVKGRDVEASMLRRQWEEMRP